MNTSYNALLASIANTISGYRAGEISAPDAAHVDRWVNQFAPAIRHDILVEIDHVLNRTYFSRGTVEGWLDMLASAPNLCGPSPATFWQQVGALDLQANGASQKEMLSLLDTSLQKQFSISLSSPQPGQTTFVYLDDFLFSGNTFIRELRDWINNEAPLAATVHAMFIATHTYGEFYAKKQLKLAAKAAGKSIELRIWASGTFENRKAYTSTSEVYRPVSVDGDPNSKAYADDLKSLGYPPQLRVAGAMPASGIFASNAGRSIVEETFLAVGAELLTRCQAPSPVIRPLGYSRLRTLGFGATVVTYRNCPNNAPLALWWGDGSSGKGPLAWYPLVPRRTKPSVLPIPFSISSFPSPMPASAPTSSLATGSPSSGYRTDRAEPDLDPGMPWEFEAMRAIEAEIAELEFDQDEGVVSVLQDRWTTTFESIDALRTHLEDVYNEAWYANVPFEGGLAVFEDDADSAVFEALENIQADLADLGWEL